jgi:FkbM family methyltransferase
MKKNKPLKRHIKDALLQIWLSRNNIKLLNFPIPCKLPYGNYILAYGDLMGSRFFLQSYMRRPYEEGLSEFICQYLKRGMTFFDIGANQGFYSLIAAGRVADTGRVFAFEPIPSVMQKFKRNIEFNKIKNINPEQMAVSRTEGEVAMYVCVDGWESLSSLREPSEDVLSRKEIIQVSTISLNKYVEMRQIRKIDLMKIDVEGGELDVLQGGRQLWTDHRPIVVCEIEDKRTNQWNYQASTILDYLKNQNYQWFEIGSDGKLVNSNECDKHDHFSNLAAVPHEKIKTIEYLIDQTNKEL